MKYAVITPPHGFDLVDQLGLGYHFTLAQYFSDFEYASFYMRKRRQGHFIMLDNGAAELGASISLDMLLWAADLVEPDEIVMPDVLDDYEKTLERTEAALGRVVPRRRAMCPQGTTWKEWTECARQMIEMGCKTLCVAKRYEKLPGGRPHALRIVKANGWDKTHDIHLLGCYDNPMSEIYMACQVLPTLRGVDTGAAVAYAQQGVSLDHPFHCSLEWDKSFDEDRALRNMQYYVTAHEGVFPDAYQD